MPPDPKKSRRLGPRSPQLPQARWHLIGLPVVSRNRVLAGRVPEPATRPGRIPFADKITLLATRRRSSSVRQIPRRSGSNFVRRWLDTRSGSSEQVPGARESPKGRSDERQTLLHVVDLGTSHLPNPRSAIVLQCVENVLFGVSSSSSNPIAYSLSSSSSSPASSAALLLRPACPPPLFLRPLW